MNGEPGRALRAGVVVLFRLEDTMELLWKSRLTILPPVGESCFRIMDSVETEYKVERVPFDFIHENDAEVIGHDSQGVPQYGEFIPSVVAIAAPFVVVSVVPVV